MQGAASSIFQHGEKHRDVIDTYGKKKEKRKKKKIGEKRNGTVRLSRLSSGTGVVVQSTNVTRG